MKSLKKLAQELGVSTATVSYVYHGKWKEKRISEALATKIQKALAQAGVRPSQIGTQLKTGRSMMIGVLLPDFETAYWLNILKGIESITTASGLLMVIANTVQGKKESETLTSVAARGVDGIIMAPYTTPDVFSETYTSLGSKIPIVFVDAHLEFKKTKIDYVVTDNRKGAFDLVHTLLSSGRKRIAYLGPTTPYNSALNDRIKGFKEAHKIHGIPINPALFQDTTPRMSDTLDKLLRLPSPPDALFVTSLSYFDEGFKMLAARGIKVPEDMSIVGFDSFDPHSIASANIDPKSILRAEQDGESMGRLAASRLKELIQNQSVSTQLPGMELVIPYKAAGFNPA